MKLTGKELKYLADIADLARLDFEAASITLAKKDGNLISRYRGAYSSGQRWMENSDPSDLGITVSAMQFKSMVSLFEDGDEVQLTVKDNVLYLDSRVHVKLNTKGDPEEDLDPFEPEVPSTFEVLVPTLLNEVQCASEFSARSMAKPVLTGIRLINKGNRLALQSSDGVSILFQTELAVENGQEEKTETICPGYDLVLGLRLLEEGPVRFIRTNSNIILYGNHAMFRSSLLSGSWPDFTNIQKPRVRQAVTIKSNLVRSLVQSVRILGTSNDLRLRGDGESLWLETLEAEAGGFQAPIASTIKGTFVFDVGSFLLAQELGSELTVELPTEEGKVPTFIQSGPRKLWIASKL